MSIKKYHHTTDTVMKDIRYLTDGMFDAKRNSWCFTTEMRKGKHYMLEVVKFDKEANRDINIMVDIDHLTYVYKRRGFKLLYPFIRKVDSRIMARHFNDDLSLLENHEIPCSAKDVDILSIYIDHLYSTGEYKFITVLCNKCRG